MIDSIARCPKWLIEPMNSHGGAISFYEYMGLALNDPVNGFYSSGRINIGKNGDFCTSPSLGNDFANLLAIQIVEWFLDLEKACIKPDVFSLVEIGPGEGTLSKDLIGAIYEIAPHLMGKIEIVLVEINVGMKRRQEKVVNQLEGVEFRWSSLEDLSNNQVTGIVIANEVLDALPVERLVFRQNKVFRQGVSMQKKNNEYFLEFVDLETTPAINKFLKDSENLLKIKFPPEDICNGWVTEWHCDIPIWFNKLSKVLMNGSLLVVDYALESRRYYNATRNTGTLIAYKNQKANSNILKDAGFCDLTAHICIESTISYAIQNGWEFLGETRQGQALLALGLPKLFSSLQSLANDDLTTALNRRESLLRLVDPMGLGDFRWLAFKKKSNNDLILRNKFLEEPIH